MVQHVEPGGELAIDLTLDQSDLVMDAGGCAELGDELFLRITFIAKCPRGRNPSSAVSGKNVCGILAMLPVRIDHVWPAAAALR